MNPKTLRFGTLLAAFLPSLTAQARTELGTPAEVITDIAQSDVAALGSIVLPLDNGNDVPLLVREFRLDEELVLTGSVAGIPDSAFMLRGTSRSVHGWVHFRSNQVAYEYATDQNGVVIVQEVPVRKVCSSCDGSHPRARVAVSTPTLLYAPTPSFFVGTATATEPHLGDYTGADLLTLESRPGAPKVIYLNISGILTNGTPSSATASQGYSAWTKEDIWRVWQTVASGLSAFDVNVTTSPTVFANTATKNVGVADFIAKNDTSVCYQDGFGTKEWHCSIYATKPCEYDALGFGRTALHEVGHLLGMLDAGDTGGAYYEGNQTYKWYPIMGDYYYATDADNDVVQWSKGEWTGANSDSKIDALASIDKYLDLRADDIATAKPLTITDTGTVSADSNRGQITSMADTDSFTFQIGSSGGKVTLTIDRIEYVGGAMLDVLATLQDSGGTTIATSNPTASRHASITQTLSAGTYTLIIQGGNEGTASNGFTAYSSIGFYGIEGTISGAINSGSAAGGAGGTASTGGATGTAATNGGTASIGGTASTSNKTSTGGNSNATTRNNTGGTTSTSENSSGSVSAGGKSGTSSRNTAGGKGGGSNMSTGGVANTAVGGQGNATGGSTNSNGNTSTGGKAGSLTTSAVSSSGSGGAQSTNASGGGSSGKSGTKNTGTGNVVASGGSVPGSRSSTTLGGTSGGKSGSTTATSAIVTSANEADDGTSGCSCSVPGKARYPVSSWIALGLLPMWWRLRRHRARG
jgi:hypothetical protein